MPLQPKAPPRSEIRAMAKDRWHRDGEIEIDDNAKVSVSGDGEGAYVQAWVWVDFPEE